MPADVTQLIDSIDAVELRHTFAVLLRRNNQLSRDICKYRIHGTAAFTALRGLFEPEWSRPLGVSFAAAREGRRDRYAAY